MNTNVCFHSFIDVVSNLNLDYIKTALVVNVFTKAFLGTCRANVIQDEFMLITMFLIMGFSLTYHER